MTTKSSPGNTGSGETLKRYAVAVFSVAVGVVLRSALNAAAGATVPFLTFFPAVMLAASYGGIGPGILATFLSLLAAIYFAKPPFFRDAASPADTIVAVAFVFAASFICVLNEALRRARARSDQRYRELQTTLASIGDAVIAADAEGRVTFLNAVARQLTGWSQEEAIEKPLSEVFVIRNEQTGLPVENPVEKAIREGVTVGLANHSVLVNRDGRRIPIEDTASPIRDQQHRTLGAVLVFRDVSAHRSNEDALKRSEERLKLAVAAGKIGVWDWDILRNQTECSERLYEIYGVDCDQDPAFGDHLQRFIHPQDRERVNAALDEALNKGSHYEVEYRVIHPSGDTRWVCTMALVILDEKGTPVRMLGATTDETARKRAEADLRQQWQTFDAALSNTPDFTYTFDLAGRFTYANRPLLSLLQRSLEDVLGKNFPELDYPPELAERLQRQIQQVIESREPLRDQTPFAGPAGETRTYEYIFVPVLGANGDVESVTGSTRDVTERTEVEEALRESQDRLRAIFDGTFEYIGLLAPDGTLLEANRASLEFANNARIDVLGRPFWEGPWFADTAGASETVHNAVKRAAAGESVRFEATVRRPSGESPTFDISLQPIRNEKGDIVLIVPEGRDITERKRAEEDLKRSNEGLKRANRELEEFAYVASHDLQEPLRMVNIYTQLILKDPAVEKPALSQYAGFVRQGVLRMEALIRDLLTFSHTVQIENPPAGAANLAESLAEAFSVLENRIQESRAIIAADQLPVVRGDTSQLAHVFQNLLSNALKYRKDGKPPEIRISARADGDQWVIAVRDHGIGFDPRYADRIFGLFKRLHKDEYPGTGLGLAICRRILERYGGRIWAEGTPGEGAAFYFALPRADRQ